MSPMCTHAGVISQSECPWCEIANLRAQLEKLQRTVKFQEDQYLADHGGSWGECKYKAQLERAEKALRTLADAADRLLPVAAACKHENFSDLTGNEMTRTETIRNTVIAIRAAREGK